MSVATSTGAITTQTLQYLPAVLAGVQTAEVSGATGQGKLNAVLQGIQAGSGLAAGSANADVAGIATLINLVVSIFNATNVFKKKAK